MCVKQIYSVAQVLWNWKAGMCKRPLIFRWQKRTHDPQAGDVYNRITISANAINFALLRVCDYSQSLCSAALLLGMREMTFQLLLTTRLFPTNTNNETHAHVLRTRLLSSSCLIDLFALCLLLVSNHTLRTAADNFLLSRKWRFGARGLSKLNQLDALDAYIGNNREMV